MLALTLVIGLLELDLWVLRAGNQDHEIHETHERLLAYVLIAAVVASACSRRVLGGGHARAWRLAIAASVALGGALALAGWCLCESHEEYWRFLRRKSMGELAAWLLLKFVVIAGQQLALQWFLVPRLVHLIRHEGAAKGLAAAVFAALHLPNLTLVILCAGAGRLWILLYERTGRILPVMASHFVLAVLLHGLWPERLHLDLRVGSQAAFRLQEQRRENEQRRRLQELASPEYYARQGGTDEQFLRGLYRDVLAREPGRAELAGWRERLPFLDRALIVETFLNAGERQAR
ncbi:MAG: CPBP family glutamic-type intramembrane protease [Acidobacteria bacterium]|nr:CPBP family glutamic-type intramembrane protease [Acidobacteriota bacterium]